MQPKTFFVIILNLNFGSSEKPASILFKVMPGRCPNQTWTPPIHPLPRTLTVQINSSSKDLEDSFLIIEPDFTIIRPQSFSEECTYNLTYKWDQEQQRYFQLPLYEGEPMTQVLVLMGASSSCGYIYDCQSPEPSFAEFFERKKCSGSELITKFGPQIPKLNEFYRKEAGKSERKKALKRCQRYMDSLDGDLDRSWVIFGAAILLIVLGLVLCYKII